jgi:hypothetical protein
MFCKRSGRISRACSASHLERSLTNYSTFRPLNKKFSLCSSPLTLNFKVITKDVRNAHQYIFCMLPVFVPLNIDTSCVPIRYWNKWRVYLRPLLNEAFLLFYRQDTLLTSCHPTVRSLMGWSRVTVRIKSKVHFFRSIFLHNFHSKHFVRVRKGTNLPQNVV